MPVIVILKSNIHMKFSVFVRASICDRRAHCLTDRAAKFDTVNRRGDHRC